MALWKKSGDGNIEPKPLPGGPAGNAANTRPNNPGAPPAPGGTAEDSSEVKEEIQTVLTTLLPWGISLLLHAGIMLLALFMVWITVIRASEEEEIIVPIASMATGDGNPGGSMTMKTASTLTESGRSSRSNITAVRSPSSSLLDSATSTAGLPGGTGGGGGQSWGVIGLGGGSGEGPGGGRGGGLFGQGGGGGGSGGPGVGFYGTGGNARDVVYIIDASGSLIDTLPFVIAELKRSVGGLTETQKFNIIFFTGTQAVEVPPGGMKKATRDLKKRVMEWMDPATGHIKASGATNPLPAIQLALRQKPQLIFLLSDNITGQGKYEIDQARLIAEIAKANTANTKINTIQFLYPDKLTTYGKQATLQMISEKTGGIYKYLDAGELGIQ